LLTSAELTHPARLNSTLFQVPHSSSAKALAGGGRKYTTTPGSTIRALIRARAESTASTHSATALPFANQDHKERVQPRRVSIVSLRHQLGEGAPLPHAVGPGLGSTGNGKEIEEIRRVDGEIQKGHTAQHTIQPSNPGEVLIAGKEIQFFKGELQEPQTHDQAQKPAIQGNLSALFTVSPDTAT